jgi:hypothetical protein
MSVVLRVVDQIAGRAPGVPRPLTLVSERITAREVLARRLQADAELFASVGRAERLFQPSHAEDERAPIDWRKQVQIACAAFERNAFLMLLDDKQVESLDDELVIGPSSELLFLKLVPLVGG